jgi:hypothetical protein
VEQGIDSTLPQGCGFGNAFFRPFLWRTKKWTTKPVDFLSLHDRDELHHFLEGLQLEFQPVVSLLLPALVSIFI